MLMIVMVMIKINIMIPMLLKNNDENDDENLENDDNDDNVNDEDDDNDNDDNHDDDQDDNDDNDKPHVLIIYLCDPDIQLCSNSVCACSRAVTLSPSPSDTYALQHSIAHLKQTNVQHQIKVGVDPGDFQRESHYIKDL